MGRKDSEAIVNHIHWTLPVASKGCCATESETFKYCPILFPAKASGAHDNCETKLRSFIGGMIDWVKCDGVVEDCDRAPLSIALQMQRGCYNCRE
jgi:hypothetical protein